MKKLLFAMLTIVMIGACNSPQKMSGPNGDSTGMMDRADSGMMQADTSARKDSVPQ